MGTARLEDIAEVSDLLYEAVYDTGLWARAMARFRRLMNASESYIGLTEAGPPRVSVLQGGCTPHFQDMLLSPDLDNIFLDKMLGTHVGIPFGEMALMSRAEFERTPFYNEWMVPQDIGSTLTVKTLDATPPGLMPVAGHVSFNRPVGRGGFDDADSALLATLIPDLRRVSALYLRFGALRLDREAEAAAAQGLALIVTDAGGRIVFSGRLGAALFDDPRSGLTATGGVLAATDRRRQPALAAMLASAASRQPGRMAGGDLALSAGHGEAPALALSIVPMRDAGDYGLPIGRAAAVFAQWLRPTVPPTLQQRLGPLFGLTPREADLAVAMAEGASLQHAADSRAISMATARTQLANIFRKTGTSRQGELVALLLTIRGVPPEL